MTPQDHPSQMNEELLTLKEISRRLNVPESSIRYYRDRFEEYLPARGEGRKRRYRSEALEIFRTIVQGYKNDRNAEEIKDHLERQLQSGSSHIENVASSQSSALQTFDASSKSPQDILQSQAQTLSCIANLLVNKDRWEGDISHLREEQQKIKKGLVQLWKKYKQKQHKAPQSDPSSSTYADIEKQLYNLQQDVTSLQRRQDELEQKQSQEMQELRQQVEKCQFWTKRLMLCSRSELPEEDSS
jgi:DNA-binding transcriptional MerR regulator